MNAMSLTSALTTDSVTSKIVFPLTNGLEMPWTNARPVPAKVIDVKTFGNRPKGEFVCNPMSTFVFTVKPKLSVTAWILGCQPRPTLILKFRYEYLAPKALHEVSI